MQKMPVDVLLGGNFIDRYTPYGYTMKRIMFTLQGEKITTPKLVYASEKHPSIYMVQTTKPLADLKALIIQSVCSDDPQKNWEKEMPKMEIKIKPEEKMKNGKKIPIPTHDYDDMQQAIKELKKGKYIVHSQSDFNCYAFMVNKESEKKRGNERMVINYKPLHDITIPFPYPIPDKSYLLQKVANSKIFLQFDCKLGFY